MKRDAWVIIGLIAMMGIIALGFLVSNPRNALTELNSTRLTIGSEEVIVEIASTPLTRAKGLSGRPALDPDKGMLFVFPNPGIYQIVMRDMNFPIDIIWINKDRKVVGISENAQPESFPGTYFEPPEPILYVLEVNAFWAANKKVGVGEIVSFEL